MAVTPDFSTRIAVLPTPGMGHLIPLVQFALKLYTNYQIATTFIIPTDGPLSAAQSAFLSTLPSAVDYILLPHVHLHDLPPDSKVETRISLTVARSLPALNHALKSLHESENLAAFVVDQFGADAFEIASDLKIPIYLFFPSTAMVLSLIFHLPILDKTVSSEFRDAPEKFRIPGCVPIHGRDLMDPIQDRNSDSYKWILHQLHKWRVLEGIIINSFQEIEPLAIETLQKKLKIYPVGPLTQLGLPKCDHICLEWLNQQPQSSVLYVSFGSGGTLSHDQTIELALGLELSQQRFLWVIRCPNNTRSNANFFDSHNSDDPLAYLPQGFVQRTKDRGLVIPFWTPQAEILAHASIGGFLSHCGWNSSLESMVNGVPIIAWPLYAEQKMNAVMLHEDVGVALRPVAGENGLVGRDEVASVIVDLMTENGERVRKRAGELKMAAEEVLKESGSSARSLADLAARWKKRC